MFILNHQARLQAVRDAIDAAFVRAWRYDEEGTPGITLVNTLAFASLCARGGLHVTLTGALLLMLAAAFRGDAPPHLVGQVLAALLFAAAVLVPLFYGYRAARMIDAQAFLPPSE